MKHCLEKSSLSEMEGTDKKAMVVEMQLLIYLLKDLFALGHLIM